MDFTTGIIKNLDVKGPVTTKFGQSYIHEYVLNNGIKYVKFAKTNTPEHVPGLNVRILFASKPNARDATKQDHTIKEIKTLGSSTEDFDDVLPTIPAPEVVAAPVVKAATVKTTGLPAKDLSIARMNAVTSAVNLLGTGTTLGTVITLAEEIVAYTTAPYLN